MGNPSSHFVAGVSYHSESAMVKSLITAQPRHSCFLDEYPDLGLEFISTSSTVMFSPYIIRTSAVSSLLAATIWCRP
jgi:hypothetical protein